jgi:hypothetical protein
MNKLMRRVLVIVVLMLAASCLALGQTTGKKESGKDERAREALMQLERDIGKANVERDYAFFERVEAEEAANSTHRRGAFSHLNSCRRERRLTARPARFLSA